MRTLSGTLLAAQRSASTRPYLRVRLYDRDTGAVRLRWRRWYTGDEPDGPCGAGVSADGSLLRVRVDPSTGTVSHQRVPSPSETSDFTSWTSLGTVLVAPRLGMAAAGARAMLATVQADGITVEARESTDSGASFGGSSTVATAGGTVTAVSCALQADGSAAVFYAVAGVVFAVTRAGTGAWSAPQAWTQSLASVSAIAACFENDYDVLVSGSTAAGDAGVWATMLGAGGGAPPGSWSALADVALASSGTNVSYLATGAARADVPRALLVESYGGDGAYDRAHIAAGVALSLWSDFLWRDPRPFDHASPHGLAVAAGAADAWLCAPHGVWHAPVAVTVDELTDDVFEARMEQAAGRGRVSLLLRNDDGRYNAGARPAALRPGGELLVAPGYETAAGAESSEGPRFWITSVRRLRRGAVSTVEVEAVDGWGLLRAWTAPRQLVWTGGSKTAFQVLSDLVRRTGLKALASGASAEATTLQPAFTVRAGERGAGAVSRLVASLPDVVVMSGLNVTLMEPKPDDATAYAYGDGHAVLDLRAEDGGQIAGWARVFGNGVFAEAIDGDALLDGAGAVIAVDDNLAVQARADARASTLLRQATLAGSRGELTAAPNVGHDVGDVIDVSDPALGETAVRFRVGALRLRYARGGSRPRYEMTLSLSEV